MSETVYLTKRNKVLSERDVERMERRSYKDRAWIVNGSGRVVRRETIREAVMHELTPVAFEIA